VFRRALTSNEICGSPIRFNSIMALTSKGPLLGEDHRGGSEQEEEPAAHTRRL
jgi:hypothetical protein